MAPLLQVDDLVKHYGSGGVFTRKQAIVKAVDGVSFSIAPGETLAKCGGSPVACFVDPCRGGHAVCRGGACALASGDGVQ